MGQLIKLEDYISRYEQNIFSYPSRFVRLKVQQWERTKSNWEAEGIDASNLSIDKAPADWMTEQEKQPFFEKLKEIFRFNKLEDDEEDLIVEEEKDEDSENSDPSSLQFSASYSIRPSNIDQLKQQFLDQLFKFQMKWASSTLTEKSFLNQSYYYEERLKFFLQRFPDTYLFLYKPVFLLKQAPVETEVIVISPTEVLCISFLEAENSSVFSGSNERFWIKRNNKDERKILNPSLALNRTEKIVKNIFRIHEIDLPIHKLILSRNGYIDYPSSPFDVQLVDNRSFEQWFQAMRSLRSPLKHMQLRAAQILLQYCQTTSVRRIEWDQSDQGL